MVESKTLGGRETTLTSNSGCLLQIEEFDLREVVGSTAQGVWGCLHLEISTEKRIFELVSSLG